MMRGQYQQIVSVLLLAIGLVLTADAETLTKHKLQTDIYGARQNEPTCCYSEENIWEKTGSQSGWSINRRSYDAYGFRQRDEYRSTQPEPLPRDREGGNPWSVQTYEFAGDSRRTGNAGNPWANAQFYQPPDYMYPAPVGNGLYSGHAPYGLGGITDPYLGMAGLGAPGLLGPGAFYPGLGGPLGLLGPLTPLGLYGPGIGLWPGLGPGVW